MEEQQVRNSDRQYQMHTSFHNHLYVAGSGEDFTFATNTATFGVSSVTGDVQCLDVTVIGDSDYESDETVTFDLSATRTGQAGSANTFTLTITNDDAGEDCL